MQTVFFNGIQAANGKYAFPPLDVRQMARRIVANPMFLRGRHARVQHGAFVRELQRRSIQETDGLEYARLPQRMEATALRDPAYSGWGILYPESEKEQLFDQLKPLLELRRQQAGDLYREIPYQPGQGLFDVLEAVEAPPFGASFEEFPHYLLIVGTASQTPFHIQYGLDRQFAVGRLGFDQLEDYGRYARNVVRHENRVKAQLKTTLFATDHPQEPTTTYSAAFLGRNLARRINNTLDPARYLVDTRIGDQASKDTLRKLMGGPLTPDLLLTATHGYQLEPSEPERETRQGAAVCAEYPGPKAWGGKALPRRMVYAGADVAEDSDFDGMIAFIYGCYGGGTPIRSSFPLEPGRIGSPESHKPFIAHLPKRMLAVEKGCRAVIAHVDTAYIWSFTNERLQEQSQVYQAFVRDLLMGDTVGHAMDVFQQAHMEKLAQYKDLVEAYNEGRLQWEDDRLVQAWMAVNDLRNHILLGDPAVRLPHLTP